MHNRGVLEVFGKFLIGGIPYFCVLLHFYSQMVLLNLLGGTTREAPCRTHPVWISELGAIQIIRDTLGGRGGGVSINVT